MFYRKCSVVYSVGTLYMIRGTQEEKERDIELVKEEERVHVYVQACKFIYIYIHTHVCVHVCEHLYAYVSLYEHLYAYAPVPIHWWIFQHVCIHKLINLDQFQSKFVREAAIKTSMSKLYEASVREAHS